MAAFLVSADGTWTWLLTVLTDGVVKDLETKALLVTQKITAKIGMALGCPMAPLHARGRHRLNIGMETTSRDRDSTDGGG